MSPHEQRESDSLALPTDRGSPAARRLPTGRPRPSTSLVALVVALGVVALVAATLGPALVPMDDLLSPSQGSQGALAGPSASPLSVQLSVSASVGLPPLVDNLTASASGGTSPYTLELCAAASPCQNVSSWSGAAYTVSATFSVPGNYTVSAAVTDTSSTQAKASAVVDVLKPRLLGASVVSEVTRGTAPFTEKFEADVSGGTPPYSLLWSFGDGSNVTTGSQVSVNHTYTVPGLYHPTLTVVDGSGITVRYMLAAVSVTQASPSQTLEAGPLSIPYWVLGATSAVVVALIAGGFLAYDRRLRRESEELVEALWRDPGESPEETKPR